MSIKVTATKTGIASQQDSELVKGLGLTSATTLVMGSMIGSGVFIVAADIARQVDSPGLLIMAWLVTGFMTITAALAYGELAAMMPHAGGQYVYLREALGPLWGFLYGWTMFLVIQTGTIAAVGVAFGKFLGVFFPSISATRWIWHIAHVPKIPVGPMVLGNMDVGLNTQNLIGILMILLLSVVNVYGVKTGAMVQNIFTVAKAAALLGLAFVGLAIGRNPQALAANFGANFWRIGPNHAAIGMSGLLLAITLVAVAQVGSLFAADAWNNVTFTAGEVKNPSRNLPLSLALGYGRGDRALSCGELRLHAGAAAARRPERRDRAGTRHPIRRRRPRGHRRHATDVRRGGRWPDGIRHLDLHLWLQQWIDPGRGARLLRDGEGRPVLPQRFQAASQVQDPGDVAGGAGVLDLDPLPLGQLTANCSTTSSSRCWCSIS